MTDAAIAATTKHEILVGTAVKKLVILLDDEHAANAETNARQHVPGEVAQV